MLVHSRQHHAYKVLLPLGTKESNVYIHVPRRQVQVNLASRLRDEELKVEIARVHEENFRRLRDQEVWRQLNWEGIAAFRHEVPSTPPANGATRRVLSAGRRDGEHLAAGCHEVVGVAGVLELGETCVEHGR